MSSAVAQMDSWSTLSTSMVIVSQLVGICLSLNLWDPYTSLPGAVVSVTIGPLWWFNKLRCLK